MHERSQVARPTGTPSDVADAYDRWSRQYDDDQNATRDLDAFVLRQAPLHLAGARVLEVGCGTGKNSAWLVFFLNLGLLLPGFPDATDSFTTACAAMASCQSSGSSLDPRMTVGEISFVRRLDARAQLRASFPDAIQMCRRPDEEMMI